MDKNGHVLGKTSCYKTVIFPKDAKVKLGDLVTAKIASAKEWNLEVT
jgi:tRNA A37 methylthiotransferase MiaB